MGRWPCYMIGDTLTMFNWCPKGDMFVNTLAFIWDTLGGVFEDIGGYSQTCDVTKDKIECVIMCDLGSGWLVYTICGVESCVVCCIGCWICIFGCVCCWYWFLMFICVRIAGMSNLIIRACTSIGSKFILGYPNFRNSLNIWDLLSSLFLTFCSNISISRASFSWSGGEIGMTLVYSW